MNEHDVKAVRQAYRDWLDGKAVNALYCGPYGSINGSHGFFARWGDGKEYCVVLSKLAPSNVTHMTPEQLARIAVY